jgi:hypothetical protein
MKNRLSSLLSTGKFAIRISKDGPYSDRPSLDLLVGPLHLYVAPAVEGGLFIEVNLPTLGMPCLEVTLHKPASSAS